MSHAWAVSGFLSYSSGQLIWISVTYDVEGATGRAVAAPGTGGFWWDMIAIATGNRVLLWQKRIRGQTSSFVKSAQARRQQQ